MRSQETIATLNFYPNRNPRLRYFALWYFTFLLTVWTVAGNVFLGFEQSYAQPVIGVVAAVLAQLLFEWADARGKNRPVRGTQDWKSFITVLPPAIIPGLACAMLLFPNERLGPVVFAAVTSIASKVIVRAPIGDGQTQHVFNPSNFGITLTLLLMPNVGLAPPYQFTENVVGAAHWVIPGIILATGIFVHAKFTSRLPLVAGWLCGFAVQGLTRSILFGIPWVVPFVPTTSAAFALFTLYMIPDPATTPIRPLRQFGYGLLIAGTYAILLVLHIVYGLFLALFAVSALRGLSLHANALWRRSWLPSRDAQEAPRRAFGA
jgi:hypothetical protein